MSQVREDRASPAGRSLRSDDLPRLRSGHDPAGLRIKKADLNFGVTIAIKEWYRARTIQPMGRIPYDRRFTEAQVQGKSLVELGGGPTGGAIRSVWQETRTLLERCR